MRYAKVLLSILPLLLALKASAFEANDVRITQMHSFNVNGHLWVKISADNTCNIPHAYFIIERWDNQTEPLQTYRKQMYQLATVAFAAGKNIRVIGSSCYLDKYLFAEQIEVHD